MGIDHFMWGYQPHYRVHVESIAESVLNRLDRDLRPEVLLVGVLPKPVSGKHPACVEPEVECWIESNAFDDVIARAAPIRAAYPEANMFHSLQVAQERADDALYRRSIRDAILAVIDGHPGKPEDTTFFATAPVAVQDYLVSVVLAVRTSALEGHFRLSSGIVAMHEYQNFAVVRSLIDAAVKEILGDAADGLLRPDPGLWTSDRRADEMIRDAGRRLANDTAFRADPRVLDGMHGFFDSICEIASLRYELADGYGKLILARPTHESLQRRLSFAGTIRLRDHRRARKLLELASKDSALHINSDRIFALVEGTEPEADAEDLFTVRIVGHHHWELAHGKQVMMGVKYGQPYLPKPAAYMAQLQRDLPRMFPEISGEATSLLISLVAQAERERHGTLLVISEQAASEAERLKSQATCVVPCSLTPELLQDLTGIDGAVLVDPSGQCYAIGVILDGLATNEGDPARGARFNSAVKYVKSVSGRGISTLAVVVSEDRGVTLVPHLRPRVKRSAVAAAVDDLAGLATATKVRRRRYCDLFDWLWAHRFYMLQEDCARANTLVETIERRLREEDPVAISIIRQKFEPDAGMQPEFYYEPE